MSRQMKDSGIKWIGEIPETWKVKRVKHGFERKKEEAHQEEPVVLSLARAGVKVRDITNNEGQLAESYYNYNPVEPGDFLLNPMDLYSGANCSISKVSGVISPAYINLRARKGYNPAYYDYYFKTQYWAMAMFAHGKGVSFDNRWTLNANDLLNYYIPAPAQQEQDTIADYLDQQCAHIDAVIEKTKASIEEYKKLKQAVITQAVTKGIRGDRPMRDSGIEWIGEIPADWDCRKLRSLCVTISKGTTPKDISTDFSDIYRIRFIKSENIVNNVLEEKPLFTITSDVHEGELRRSQLSVQDILFVIAGASIGKVAIVKDSILPANTNQATSFIRINKKYMYSQKYVWYVLQSRLIKEYIASFAVKSAQPNISMEDLGAFKINMPKDINETKELVEYLDEKCSAIDMLIEKKEQTLTEMESYKKSLIYEYVTGKKEVPQPCQ